MSAATASLLMRHPPNHLRELTPESIETTLLLVEQEEQLLSQIIESDCSSAEERIESIQQLAILSSELTAILGECHSAARPEQASEETWQTSSSETARIN